MYRKGWKLDRGKGPMAARRGRRILGPGRESFACDKGTRRGKGQTRGEDLMGPKTEKLMLVGHVFVTSSRSLRRFAGLSEDAGLS